ncbi:MAG: terminase large subunit [FCB group bacterium]|nr:terminase large subunit [FCB group bacterium]
MERENKKQTTRLQYISRPDESRQDSHDYIREVIKCIPGYDPYRNADGYTFDTTKALMAVNFFWRAVRHIKGNMADKPYELQLHEQAIMANLFGWVDAEGYRRYRECLYYVPRKNSKTTWAAGVALFVTFFDNEQGAECYCAASDRDQATLLYGQAEAMVHKCQTLDDRCQIYKTSKTISFPSTNSFFKAISAEAASKHGYNSHLILVDELHAQPNRELVDVLLTSTGSRKQPLVVCITTADYSRESICNEKYDYACGVRDARVDDPTFLPVIYEASIEDDWTDEAVWAKANPNLGKSVSLEYIRKECAKAKEIASYENTFKRLHLNVRTQQDVRWLPMDKWLACGAQYDEASLLGAECYAGLDLASVADVTAFVMVFPQDDGTYKVLPKFWVPEENAHIRERRDKVPYTAWAKQGFLTLTPGRRADYEIVEHDILELGKKFNIRQVMADRWAFEPLRQLLIKAGMPEDSIVEFGQTYASMSSPTKETERLILGRELLHNNNPALNWMAGNVTVQTDHAENLRPDKKKSTEKIDGIVALIMALGGAMIAQKQPEYRIISL